MHRDIVENFRQLINAWKASRPVEEKMGLSFTSTSTSLPTAPGLHAGHRHLRAHGAEKRYEVHYRNIDHIHIPLTMYCMPWHLQVLTRIYHFHTSHLLISKVHSFLV